MKTTPDVRTIAITRALQLLDSLKAQYKIILPDGSGEYGALEIAVPANKKRSPLAFPYGEVRKYYQPLVENMQKGDVLHIPIDKYDLKQIQGGISTWAADTWGAGSTITSQRRDLGVVEVMRVL